jgi:plasmid stability protein
MTDAGAPAYAGVVTRLTIELPDEVAARVTELAHERGTSPEAVAREVLETNLPAEPREPPGFIALGRSGRSDLSERVKELRQAEFGG